MRFTIAALITVANTVLFTVCVLTGHPKVAAIAAIGMLGGALYLNRSAAGDDDQEAS